MRSDIRQSPQYQASIAFFRSLFGSGRDHVFGVGDGSVAPDESFACFTGWRFRGLIEDGPTECVVRMDLESGEMQVLGDEPARTVRISPCGRKLAWVIPGNADSMDQVVLLGLPERELTTLATVDGRVEDIRWAPHGRMLLLLVAGAGADLAGRDGGSALCRRAPSGPGWLPEHETGKETDLWRTLWVCNLDDASLRQISPPRKNVWEACWCGNERVAAVCSDDHAEGAWYGAVLAFIDLQGQFALLYTPADQIGLPAASPHTGAVAFIEGVCSDRGIVCGTLKVIDVRSGVLWQPDTQGVEVTSVAWRSARTLHFAGLRGIETVVADVDLDGTSVEVWSSTELSCGDWYPAASPLAQGKSLFVVESYDRPPEVAIAGDRKLATLLSLASEAARAPGDAFGTMQPVSWTAPDGLNLQGWLLQPCERDGPVPLVMDVHGGPVWAMRPRWMARLRAAALLVREGYAVFYPNPRGSAGRGSSFTRRVVGDMGGHDTADLLSGIDHLVACGVADPERIGTTGTSYGGFMSAWLITQDRRFAAAVPISPVSDWYSQHRTSQIPDFDALFLAADHAAPGGLYFERSPAMFTCNTRTPTLTLAGALDKNTPPAQAREFHQSLVASGCASELLIYPLGGHSLRGYPAYVDSTARVLGWFLQHMPPRSRGASKGDA